ncbi:thioredoxin family protein [Arenibacter sp. GZD96]|uniref:thioredoxin family protein n=1 Tax=Aurantibrevibacter litoralis TaxID=3106030 RepID=UPI002AFE1EAF|nr:thioredoxin family protein [Arenibacter sp. GZD-96]MEA1787437.1 thioredoxin family protein [Arenibacter sp. GZD-96]
MLVRFLMMICFLFVSLGITAQNWKTNFTQAQQQAASENKKLILVFQGSDWCAPCIKLNKEVWSTDEFTTYARKNYIMVQADFPRKKQNALPEEQVKANAQLAETYNKNGIFPFVVILDSQGKVLGGTSYKKMPPKEYIALLESFKS